MSASCRRYLYTGLVSSGEESSATAGVVEGKAAKAVPKTAKRGQKRKRATRSKARSLEESEDESESTEDAKEGKSASAKDDLPWEIQLFEVAHRSSALRFSGAYAYERGTVGRRTDTLGSLWHFCSHQFVFSVDFKCLLSWSCKQQHSVPS